MGLQLVVVGRRSLPPGKRLELSLRHDESDDESDIDEGELELWEDSGDEPDFIVSVEKAVGFVPKALVLIEPAGWVLSEVVADEIAHAVEGVVLCFTYNDAHIDYECNGRHQPAAKRGDLVRRIRLAFAKPRASITRRKCYVEQNAEPRAADDDDWI